MENVVQMESVLITASACKGAQPDIRRGSRKVTFHYRCLADRGHETVKNSAPFPQGLHDILVSLFWLSVGHWKAKISFEIRRRLSALNVLVSLMNQYRCTWGSDLVLCLSGDVGKKAKERKKIIKRLLWKYNMLTSELLQNPLFGCQWQWIRLDFQTHHWVGQIFH